MFSIKYLKKIIFVLIWLSFIPSVSFGFITPEISVYIDVEYLNNRDIELTILRSFSDQDINFGNLWWTDKNDGSIGIIWPYYYEINWGDGESEGDHTIAYQLPSIPHHYDKEGIYHITVTVISNCHVYKWVVNKPAELEETFLDLTGSMSLPVDLEPPTVNISSPANGVIFNHSDINVTGNAQDLTKVIEVSVNGEGADISPPGGAEIVGYSKLSICRRGLISL